MEISKLEYPINQYSYKQDLLIHFLCMATVVFILVGTLEYSPEPPDNFSPIIYVPGNPSDDDSEKYIHELAERISDSINRPVLYLQNIPATKNSVTFIDSSNFYIEKQAGSDTLSMTDKVRLTVDYADGQKASFQFP